MEIKRLHHFAGRECKSCEIVPHETQGLYIIKHLTERVISAAEKQRIINSLTAQINVLSSYDKADDIAKIQEDLANISD